jgi:type I restriction enzyme S subunit
MSELPQGWAPTTLGEIGEYLNGRGFKKSEWRESGRPIIRIQNLTGSGSHFNYFDGDAEERYIARDGDLLVSWAATLGVFVWRGPEAVVNQHIFKVESRIDRRFHRYLLVSTLNALLRQTHGSGMVHITKSRFDDTPITLPPLNEQRRIVAAIEEHLSRLDASEASLVAADGRVQALSRSAVMREIGDRWPVCPIGSLGDGTRHALAIGPFGSNLKVSDYTTTGVPLVFVRDIRRGTFGDSRTRYVSPTKARELSAHAVRPGDLLVTKMGDPPGDAAIYPRGRPEAVLTADCIKLSPSDEVLASFLTLTFQLPAVAAQIGSITKGVAQKKVSLARFKTVRVPLPPLDEQRRIVERVEEQVSTIDALRAAIERAQRRSGSLRRSVLERAFRGELVPQDPSDEPASVLLERILAERAAVPQVSRRRRATA